MLHARRSSNVAGELQSRGPYATVPSQAPATKVVCLQSGHHQKRGDDIPMSNAMGPPSKVYQGTRLYGSLAAADLDYCELPNRQTPPAQLYYWLAQA